MPNIIADINQCPISEDQLRVATQWSKTFVHNPSDLATAMTQLVMACVAKGDFRIRDYMSESGELNAPSIHLTIADYLSHASRIILDYHSLSEVNSLDLLSYFPEPGESNNVFSRSATHNVNQVKEKTVEGKGMMLGVKGQLPALLKTPRDFGLNIAMGGLGQDNFQGKKISANGFSGHFYYHRNTEHKLLLAGLEQSAPSASVLDVVRGKEPHPEEEQQGHDQFGQGHSLTGASDTYTAAGSLYFSSPVYQAKLLLEKGVFPPDKYGAMQVTITDEHWPLIKEFLGRIDNLAQRGLLEELREVLLERPSTVNDARPVYKSFVALDFNTYLKQIYKVFIESSELDDAEKSNLSLMQEKLLTHIKALQFGDLVVYTEFEKLIAHIDSTEAIPEEYRQALIRIRDLFNLQCAIDPELKNTQITRPYQIGDYTLKALRQMNRMITGAEGEMDEQEYEFGDITWGLLNRANQSRKAYHLGDLSRGVLSKVDHMINGGEEAYYFGKLTSGLLNRVRPSPSVNEVQHTGEEGVQKPKGSKLVSYARTLFWRSEPAEEQTQPADVHSKQIQK